MITDEEWRGEGKKVRALPDSENWILKRLADILDPPTDERNSEAADGGAPEGDR